MQRKLLQFTILTGLVLLLNSFVFNLSKPVDPEQFQEFIQHFPQADFPFSINSEDYIDLGCSPDYWPSEEELEKAMENQLELIDFEFKSLMPRTVRGFSIRNGDLDMRYVALLAQTNQFYAVLYSVIGHYECMPKHHVIQTFSPEGKPLDFMTFSASYHPETRGQLSSVIDQSLRIEQIFGLPLDEELIDRYDNEKYSGKNVFQINEVGVFEDILVQVPLEEHDTNPY